MSFSLHPLLIEKGKQLPWSLQRQRRRLVLDGSAVLLEVWRCLTALHERVWEVDFSRNTCGCCVET
jgi:hypothetical protein